MEPGSEEYFEGGVLLFLPKYMLCGIVGEKLKTTTYRIRDRLQKRLYIMINISKTKQLIDINSKRKNTIIFKFLFLLDIWTKNYQTGV